MTSETKQERKDMNITPDEEIIKLALHLCQGIPGAITVLANVLNEQPSCASMVYLKLAERKIVGSDIWVLFKKCDRDIDTFIKTLLDMK